ITLPLLRKDFILDEVQVRQSLLYGADAILLMVRILSPEELRDLIALCHELGIEPLTEVHDRAELETALNCGAEIIGINNRDFNTFNVTLDTTLQLASMVPAGCTLISESGIESGADIKKLGQCGVQAVLVGSALMRSKDLIGKARELVQAGRDNHAQS
ncbi:indole-3-glycerol-phosphate synthase, partial [Thermodesulfobacteriota bacterium]